jgi:hypothetical protein
MPPRSSRTTRSGSSRGGWAHRRVSPLEISAGLASANLNEGIRNYDESRDEEGGTDSTLLFAQNGNLVLRALTSDKYTRIWNSDVTARLIKLTQDSPEWQPAPAAFDGSRGLYASEKDVFAFMVDDDRRIFETLPGGGLSRGFFISNSEVGDASFSLTTFLYQYVCGNHMVWGAQGVKNIRIPHIGNADDARLPQHHDRASQVRERVGGGATRRRSNDDQVRVQGHEGRSARHDLQADRYREGTIARRPSRSRQERGSVRQPALDLRDRLGITEIARDKVNADERVKLEKDAGKVAQIAFA